MPPRPKLTRGVLFADPNQEPIRAVDQVTFHRSRTAHLDITCCAHVPVSDGSDIVTENIVTARLRMDLSMAKALADGLTKQIAMLEAAENPVN